MKLFSPKQQPLLKMKHVPVQEGFELVPTVALVLCMNMPVFLYAQDLRTPVSFSSHPWEIFWVCLIISIVTIYFSSKDIASAIASRDLTDRLKEKPKPYLIQYIESDKTTAREKESAKVALDENHQKYLLDDILGQ